MNGLMAILRREVARQSGLLAVGLALGLAALGSPYVGVWDGNLAAQFAVFTTFVTATVLAGGSALTPDLVDRRLGFLFTRPVPWWAIWGGRLGAAVLVSLTAIVLAAVPGLAHGDITLIRDEWYLRIFVPGLLVCVGAAHLLATTYRSRDPWAALDVLFFTVTIVVLVLLELGVSQAGGLFFLTGYRSMTVVLWTMALVLAGASAAQVAGGRSDVVRGRRIASIVVWSGALVAVLATGVVARRLRHPQPGDLDGFSRATALPGGRWIFVAGPRRWFSGYASLLFDPATGRAVPSRSFIPPALTPDGRRAAWPVVDWRLRMFLEVVDLQEGASLVARWRFREDDGRFGPLALSPDGRLAFVAGTERAHLLDLATGRDLIAMATGAQAIGAPLFTGPATVRALRLPGRWFAAEGEARIVEITAEGERVLGTFRAGRGQGARWSAGGSRLLFEDASAGGSRVAVLDGATAGVLAAFTAPGRNAVATADFLGDGRMAVALSAPDRRVIVARPDGSVERTVELPSGNGRLSLAAVSPDVVAVGSTAGTVTHTMLVDTRSGALREVGGLRIAPAAVPWFWAAPRAARPLFLDGETLIELDLATGARRRLLPPP